MLGWKVYYFMVDTFRQLKRGAIFELLQHYLKLKTNAETSINFYVVTMITSEGKTIVTLKWTSTLSTYFID